MYKKLIRYSITIFLIIFLVFCFMSYLYKTGLAFLFGWPIMLITIFTVIFFIMKIFELKSIPKSRIYLSLIIALSAIFIPYTSIRVFIDYEWNKKERTQLIETITKEVLKEKTTEVLTIPTENKSISIEGKFYVKNENEPIIAFCINDGPFLSATEFIIYTKESEESLKNRIEGLIEFKIIDENWYYIKKE